LRFQKNHDTEVLPAKAIPKGEDEGPGDYDPMNLKENRDTKNKQERGERGEVDELAAYTVASLGSCS